MQEKEDTTQKLGVSSTETSSLVTVDSSEETSDQFQDVKNQFLEILSELPIIITRFFGQYQKPIITVGIILGAIIIFKVMFAVVESLNDIPLLAPTFELIGIIYSGWFVYRYLLLACLLYTSDAADD